MDVQGTESLWLVVSAVRSPAPTSPPLSASRLREPFPARSCPGSAPGPAVAGRAQLHGYPDTPLKHLRCPGAVCGDALRLASTCLPAQLARTSSGCAVFTSSAMTKHYAFSRAARRAAQVFAASWVEDEVQKSFTLTPFRSPAVANVRGARPAPAAPAAAAWPAPACSCPDGRARGGRRAGADRSGDRVRVARPAAGGAGSRPLGAQARLRRRARRSSLIRWSRPSRAGRATRAACRASCRAWPARCASTAPPSTRRGWRPPERPPG